MSLRKLLTALIVSIVLVLTIPICVAAQCSTWHDLLQKEELENAYVLYRSHLLAGDLDRAFPYWEVVYQAAPAADGVRSHVYSDGRRLLNAQLETAKGRKRKTEVADFIIRLLEDQRVCYPDDPVEPLPERVLRFKSTME